MNKDIVNFANKANFEFWNSANVRRDGNERLIEEPFITISSLFKYQHVTPRSCTSSVSDAV